MNPRSRNNGETWGTRCKSIPEMGCGLLFVVSTGSWQVRLLMGRSTDAAAVSQFRARPGSRFRLPHSVSSQIWERELRHCLNGCAFVIMQTENYKLVEAPAKPFEERFDIHALGVDSPRNKGDIVEAKFLAKASSMGFGVARPWATERYDFVLDSGYGFWRVQVKSNRGRADGGYLVKVSGYKRVAYTERDIDFLVAYCVPEDLWYIVPIKKFIGTSTLFFYPHGRGTSRWEKYREAWCLMACPH